MAHAVIKTNKRFNPGRGLPAVLDGATVTQTKRDQSPISTTQELVEVQDATGRTWTFPLATAVDSNGMLNVSKLADAITNAEANLTAFQLPPAPAGPPTIPACDEPDDEDPAMGLNLATELNQ